MSTVQSFNSPLFQPIVPMDGGAYSVAPGYLAKFYSAGTAIPKTIYTDPGLTVPYSAPGNIAVLDAAGSALIYLGAGGYKLVLTDPSGNPVPGWTIDNINGEGSFGTGFVNSFAELADVNTTLNKYTYIGGYYTPGDGGGGMFYNETSGTSADGGYVQDSNFDPTKKWFRVPDENGKVRTASFGAIGLSQNRTNEILAADAYATSNNLTLLWNVFSRTDTMTLSAPTVEFAQGAFLRGFGAATVTFNGVVSGPDSTIFSHSLGGGLDVVLANPSQQSNPYWFEASPTQSAGNNATSFAKWKSAGAGLFVVPPGTWPHTGSFTPAAGKITIFSGSVGGNIPGTFYGPASLINGNLDLDITGGITTTGGVTSGGTVAGAFGFFDGLQVNGNGTISGSLTADTISGTTSVTGGAVVSSTTVTAGTNITANDDVRAGNSGEGHLIARAGVSTNTFRAGGVGQFINGSSNPTLAPNAVTGLYDAIKIVCAGTCSSTTPDIRILIGTETVFLADTLLGASNTSYYAEVIVYRTSPTEATCVGFASINGDGGGSTAISGSSVISGVPVTWANSNTISHTITPSGSKTMTMYQFLPYDGT